jgi:hypothetical protein
MKNLQPTNPDLLRADASDAVKQLFKTTMIYSICKEETEFTLIENLKKQLSDYFDGRSVPKILPAIDITDETTYKKWKRFGVETKHFNCENMSDIVFSSILYDLIKKAITLDETKKMFQSIIRKSYGKESLMISLSDELFQSGTSSIATNLCRNSFLNDITKTLIQLLDNDEWFIQNFTDYIQEIIPISKMNNIFTSLHLIDWEQRIVSFLMIDAARGVVMVTDNFL